MARSCLLFFFFCFLFFPFSSVLLQSSMTANAAAAVVRGRTTTGCNGSTEVGGRGCEEEEEEESVAAAAASWVNYEFQLDSEVNRRLLADSPYLSYGTEKLNEPACDNEPPGSPCTPNPNPIIGQRSCTRTYYRECYSPPN